MDMHPDHESGGTSQTTRGPRRRGRGRHFRPTRRPRPATDALSAKQPSTAEDPTESPQSASLQDEVEESTTLTEEPPRRERGDRSERTPRGERPPRTERAEKSERAEAADRGSDGGREDRAERVGASAIARAVDHANQIIADLTEALEEMELVLELLEEAERQKVDDEREIKGLQKALERVQRFRGSGRSSERTQERAAE